MACNNFILHVCKANKLKTTIEFIYLYNYYAKTDKSVFQLFGIHCIYIMILQKERVMTIIIHVHNILKNCNDTQTHAHSGHFKIYIKYNCNMGL